MKREMLESCVKTYSDLTDYWSNPHRMVMKDDAILDARAPFRQTKAFIEAQHKHCAETLAQVLAGLEAL